MSILIILNCIIEIIHIDISFTLDSYTYILIVLYSNDRLDFLEIVWSRNHTLRASLFRSLLWTKVPKVFATDADGGTVGWENMRSIPYGICIYLYVYTSF